MRTLALLAAMTICLGGCAATGAQEGEQGQGGAADVPSYVVNINFGNGHTSTMSVIPNGTAAASAAIQQEKKDDATQTTEVEVPAEAIGGALNPADGVIEVLTPDPVPDGG